MIASPCVKRCAVDESGQSCTACLRTLDEIIDWPTLTDEDKRAVLQRVAARRSALEAASRATLPGACQR